MKRACLSIFAALSLLIGHLQPVAFGQSKRASMPPAQTSQLNLPASAPGEGRTQPGNQAQGTPSPADPAADKVKRGVEKTGVAQKITVFLKIGDALHGTVTRIDRDEFAIAEVDLQRIFTIQYKDVKRIRSGYGGINLFTGKRVSPPKAARIAVIAGLLFLIVGMPVIALGTAED